MPDFIPGIELSHRFYEQAVRPLLDRFYPGLPHAAALLGAGSEVLGFDTAMSMDHDWFPKVWIFLRDQDEDLKEPIRLMLSQNLPHRFLGEMRIGKRRSTRAGETGRRHQASSFALYSHRPRIRQSAQRGFRARHT